MTLWKDRFSVVEYQEVTKPNGSTGFEEVAVLESQPCKLSFSTLNATDQTDANAVTRQTTKLFCDNELTIKAGSKITVQHAGRTFEFSQSGEAGIFTVHQEIVLEPFRGWA
jgi:hypothetical protein